MDNYYEFKYKYDKQEVTHRINADATINELYLSIRYFLLGCSWLPDAVDKIMSKEE